MNAEFLRILHRKVISHLDSRNTGCSAGQEDKWKTHAEEFLMREMRNMSIPEEEKDRIRDEVLNEVFAFGPITGYLRDPSISEIMVNGKDAVYIERKGKVSLSNRSFLSEDTLRATIDRIVSRVNRRLDESSPFVDARLEDGSRVNAIIPPVSLSGPCLTIRKFREDPYSLDELIRIGSLTEYAAEYLREAVSRRKNIIISGGTGSGKTTLLNSLSQYVHDEERILTIEDAAEIRLMKPHVIRLEARPANIEGGGSVSIRDLVRNSLRMRPDRIIVGECRGGEALDMLQAMNTGHNGSITTGHANSPRDMLRRLETMVLLSGVDIPVRAIREQIASAIDLIVHTCRMADGKRIVASISEVTGMAESQILLQDIFRLDKPTDISGPCRLVPSGVPSNFFLPKGNQWE